MLDKIKWYTLACVVSENIKSNATDTIHQFGHECESSTTCLGSVNVFKEVTILC